MSFQFRGQRANEEVEIIIREHPVSLVGAFLKSLSPMLLPVLLYFFVSFGSIFFLLILFSLAISITLSYVVWYKWFNTVILVTNERFIYLKQTGVMNKELSECSLDGIQQVNHKIGGVMRTMFNYGTLEISLSGSSNSIRVANVPNPYDFQQELLRIVKGDDFMEE